jgi:MoxR-like ATPase
MEKENTIAGFSALIRSNIEKVFLGKTAVIDMLLAAFLARGHVLLEDVPGTGKTILARAFAASLNLSFSRVQCTPDLLPADILGVSIWRQNEGKFVYRKGPVVNQFVLVDEINRATPRTQSALLEAMAEGQISVDGSRINLPEPFIVMATQNPIEYEGTFPLPEAQKDRFLLSLKIGYPDQDSEAKMLESQRRITHPVTDLKPVASAADVVSFQEEVTKVYVDVQVRNYLLSLIAATREENSLRAGISPRGSLALYRASQALASLRGRDFVSPTDIKEMAPPVFRQRLLLSSEALVRGIQPDRIITSILDSVPMPEYRASL